MTRTQSSTLRNFLSISVTVLFFVYLYLNRKFILDALANIKPQYFILALVGQFGCQLANSGILRTTLKPLGIIMNRYDAYKITVISSFVNFFAPVVGGIGTKAVYLKSEYGLDYSSFASAAYANYMIMFIASFSFGLIGILISNGAINNNIGRLLSVFFAGSIIFFILILLQGHRVTQLVKKYKAKHKILKRLIDNLTKIDESWEKIRNDGRMIGMVCFWSVITLLSLSLVYWASMKSVNIDTSASSIMIFTALSSVALLFNLTPGGLGIRELLYSSVYSITAINANNVVTFSLVDRASQMLFLGLSWLMFGSTIIKNINVSKKVKSSKKTKQR